MRNKPCDKGGCHGIVRQGVCSACAQTTRRGTNSERGYDARWRKVRQYVITDATMEAAMAGVACFPICEVCDKPIEEAKGIHVDHILPFVGRNDPLRLLHSNLRVMHQGCHMRMHGEERRT